MELFDEAGLGDEMDRCEPALREYAGLLEAGQREAMLALLDTDPAFRVAMARAVTDMALLMGGATLIENEAEFVGVRESILERATADSPEVRAMRLYYLEHRAAVDVPMETRGEHDRCERRLLAFQADYLACQRGERAGGAS